MKKDVTIFLLLIISLSFVLGGTRCDLNVTLLNQDPYPAVPGDYVKLVFQVEGINPSRCDDISFNLLADYPIEFNPGESGLRTFKEVDYIKDYESNILIPYKVKINKDALNGANPVEIRVQSRNEAPISKMFDIEIEDVRAEFEIYVKDYSYLTNEITIEVLNIESSNIEALAIEIPKQDAIQIKGANKVVVGDLDSNEYTSASFEAVPSDGEFKVNLIYSDTINVRRTVEKSIPFDSSYFTNRKADQKKTSTSTYVVAALVVLLAGYWFYKRRRKTQERKNRK